MLHFYDLVARYCRYKKQKLSAVVNITNIDPRIFAGARREGVSPQQLAGRFMDELLSDVPAPGKKSPSHILLWNASRKLDVSLSN